jgi:hypothetical protein
MGRSDPELGKAMVDLLISIEWLGQFLRRRSDRGAS